MIKVRVRSPPHDEVLVEKPLKAIKGYMLGVYDDIMDYKPPSDAGDFADLVEMRRLWDERAIPEPKVYDRFSLNEFRKNHSELEAKLVDNLMERCRGSPFSVGEVYRNKAEFGGEKYSDETIARMIRMFADSRVFTPPILINLEHGRGKYTLNPVWVKAQGK